MPLVPCQEPLFELPGALHAERGHGYRWQRDGSPAALRFWLDERRLAFDPLQRPSDSDGIALKVDVLPPQSKQFPLAHPRGERRGKEWPESVVFGELQECSRLLSTQ